MVNQDKSCQEGLYRPQFEHDACGIGFVCQMKGKKSHQLVQDGLEILRNMAHRGGVGSEADSGDGAGILIQIPHKFMAKVCYSRQFPLPGEKDYGVGMLFMSPDKECRTRSYQKLQSIIEEEGQTLLGLRDVPIQPSCIGASARETMPHIAQVFIKRAKSIPQGLSFERKLFVIQKRAEKEIRNSTTGPDPYFYFSSLSSATIVYKGMLTADQLPVFYLDLRDLDMQSAIALVHSRFSTNTFPSWERAHPNSYLVHNGEINTVRSNVNWARAREPLLKSPLWGADIEKVLPVINPDGSDSAMLDDYVHMLSLSGYPLPEAIMSLIPEPWENNPYMDKERKDFYQYKSCMLESWDGPAAVGFSNGTLVGALLDRNGLRPARYMVTKDQRVVLSSEAGTLPIPASEVAKKDILRPGVLLVVDTQSGEILVDEELKASLAKERDYGKWLAENILTIDQVPTPPEQQNPVSKLSLTVRQKIFGYTWEDMNVVLKGMISQGHDPITSMGTDTPLAVLSRKNQLLYNYFKQLFAQVTNPPIDAMREKSGISTMVYLGRSHNILDQGPGQCQKIQLASPVLSDEDMNKIKAIGQGPFKTAVIPMLFQGGEPLASALNTIFTESSAAIAAGAGIIVLSDRGCDETHIPIPALLAVSGLHHYLIRQGIRMKASLVLESGEPREVHHLSALISYGASAVNPYLAYESIRAGLDLGLFEGSYTQCVKKYQDILTEGIIKVMSKMGISTVHSYHGAQIFEALGIHEHVVDTYFTGTVTRIGGLKLEDIQKETVERHQEAFAGEKPLETGGQFKWRSGGEYHIYNPETITLLQQACRQGDYGLYKQFAGLVNRNNEEFGNIRGLLDIRTRDKPLALHEIEPVESIVKRFKTGAMSYGSISKEAHECMAVAMNQLGAKSNSGEGGELQERYRLSPNGDNKSSAIKQIASGRFGVTIEYLQNAGEIQIKMAQGAKPGEGGHLPGSKVYPWIAKARHSTPGVELISPPPHHDIYSIEDLAQLIRDLKSANPHARISVKLVSEAGVGTIAVGVAKGLADLILISGHDGGTGAAPHTSIRHTGLPWEMGVAEAHQTLLMNNLRNRVVLETDGKLLTGRDVAIAALLGAEEFGFATGPLVAMGCVMMRVCNLDTCPAGIATQNPDLRKNFSGKPAYVKNFMQFIARDLREWMAKIGVRNVNELIGHVEKLLPKKPKDNWKAATVDLLPILYQPKICNNDYERYFNQPQDHHLEDSIDQNALIPLCENAMRKNRNIYSSLPIKNTDRCLGATLSGRAYQIHGAEGMAEDTINLTYTGSAGQSFGAFLAPGITLRLKGEGNDYVGKSLSGGKIIVTPPENAAYKAAENVIIGNVCLYGATAGEVYIAGQAGIRFGIRNSGAIAVVEGIGDNGCEYMTGGCVIVLGRIGRNFAAGMSGGTAYIYDPQGQQIRHIAATGLLLEKRIAREDGDYLRNRIEKHFQYTGSKRAEKVLENWAEELLYFVRVIPYQYKTVMELYKQYKTDACTEEEAYLKAFSAINGQPFSKRGKEGD